jgi:hypothetical protein
LVSRQDNPEPKYMSYYHQPYTFLLIVKSDQDVQKLDEAIHAKKLGYHKISEQVYLGFFFETPETTHSQLRSDFGIEDEIHWIQLPQAEVTK